MAKLTTSDLSSLTNETSAVSTINNNNAAIETAMEKTLSRDGTSPNEMNAALDMNSNRILNLPEPVADTEPARLVDVASGITGNTPGIRQTYSTTTTDADPGAGTFRLNHATPASATAAYLDNLDLDGNTVSTIFDLWDDSTSTVKGFLRLEKSKVPGTWAEFDVTGTVVDGTGYRKLTLSNGAGSGAFTNGDTFVVIFYAKGDKGDTGPSGAVGASGTPTVSQLGVWVNSTTLKGVSITGLVKGNGASDPTAATVGTDYGGPVANPTGTIGLTAVNGVATSTMRSDGAPALSQAIVPTWTQLHTFNGGANFNNLSQPIRFTDSSASAGNKIFDARSSSGTFALRLIDDGYTTANNWILVTRSAQTVTSIKFQGTVYTDLATLTDGATITWTVNSNYGQKAKVTLGGNRTMNAVTGAVEGATYFLWIIQDGTGSRTMSWTTTGAGSFDFGTAGAPTLTTTANKADLLTFEAISIGGTLKLRYTGIARGFS